MPTDLSLTAADLDEALARSDAPERPAWGAVLSMSLGVFALVTAEFLPASLLTPLAEGLQISKGAAGQAVTATALVALVTSLLITVMARGLDRRWVLMGLAGLLVVSNILVATAPGLIVLLIGRVLMGIALGGFWSLSVATVMRLVPEANIPRALAILFMGVSAATVFAVPVGSYLGAMIGWRGVFWVAALLGLIALLVQALTLPSLPARGTARLGTLTDVLARPGIGIGMLAALLAFGGHFTFFTYIRPFLENVTMVGVDGVTLILFGFGLANFLGTYLVAFLIERSLRLALIVLPLTMAVLALLLSNFGGVPALDATLIAIWGLVFAGLPVSWSTWVTRALPDEAEAGGSLIVAAINFAIASGAGLGGVLLEVSGPRGVFLASSLILVAAVVTVVSRVRAAGD
ncbi:MFS transporter [Paracoccus aminophilus]|uniref:Major facilitator superfamily transport protein n=1 Tax=Paracoccus aminophilus JCM 7686 TaxID=1367847 RepID=S5Y287_PARAH|nr:MFS transporter [Paracoccus aminophilus]AGT09870.1 major facilitator superfamily transport protein [Paracoccus aminophilus JCM 7686]